MPVQYMAVLLTENMVCVYSRNHPNKTVSLGSHGACFWLAEFFLLISNVLNLDEPDHC